MSCAQEIRSNTHTQGHTKSRLEACVCSVSGRIMARRVYQTVISVFSSEGESLNLPGSFCKHEHVD